MLPTCGATITGGGYSGTSGCGVDCDDLAAAGGTIAYETFTRLGRRFERVYI